MDQQQHDPQPQPSLWAIVELFGHQRIAGRISEQNFGGAHFVRVDVPEIVATTHRYEAGERVEVRRLIDAHTRSFGAGAIYSVNWCDEATARIAAQSIEHEPLAPYSVKSALASLPDADRNRLLGMDGDDDDELPY